MQPGNIVALKLAGQQQITRPTTLKAAAADFAAILVNQLLKHAWNAQGFLSGGPQARAFYDQLTWEYSRVMTRKSGFGIAQMIHRSLEKSVGAYRHQATGEIKDKLHEEHNG